MKPELLVIPHSEAAATRATTLFHGRPGTLVAPPSRAASAGRLVARVRPRVAYFVDVGASTGVAALVARALRVPTVIDTGDLVFELERSRGARSLPGLAAVWTVERLMLRWARHVVVRGRAHLDLLGARPATFAPDLAPQEAGAAGGEAVRPELDLEDAFVVGLVGSLQPAPRLGISYGWDLVEALAATSPRVHALIVGDGPARAELEAQAVKLGVAERCRFVGAVPPERVGAYVGSMDAAISTQTNDRVGAVRTTGKLPLYLACGCPVLASDVGEARRLLGPLGWTVRYDGVVDRGYPARLAAAIESWAADPEGASARHEQALRLHAENFDPEVVRGRVWAAVDAVLAERR